jgi:hypothetical protein
MTLASPQGLSLDWQRTGKRDGKDGAFRLNISLTVVKNAGDWQIAAMHFSTLTKGAGDLSPRKPNNHPENSPYE